jgi:hypothetical protein
MEAGLSLAPLSLTMFAVALIAGRRTGRRRAGVVVGVGFGLAAAGMALIIGLVPRADTGWALAAPLAIAGAGLGLLVSQLNNYTLAPIAEERSSEAAGVNSAAGSFGLSFGLAIAGGVLLATLSVAFTDLSESSKVIPPAQQQQIADELEHDAQVVSSTQLDEQLSRQPPAVREEIVSINEDATHRALQVALLVPLLASLLGVFNAFRMLRLPDIAPSPAAEASLVG